MEIPPTLCKTNVYGMAETDYPTSEAFGVSIFPRACHQSFPRELEDQFKHMQSNFSTGLFPLISRAWMAIDSDLFLWNFETNSDLAFYDGISNTILLVDLVVPRAGFSRPETNFLLVIATTLDILLLPLTFRDEFGVTFTSERFDFKNAYAFLLGGALFKLSLDGLIVTNLCCADDGRIFFSADDSLYELEYYEKSWYSSSTCKKINHSKSLLNSLVPVLYIFTSKDEIRQLELDDSRHILYVLFKKGSLQIFDLGIDGKSIQKLATLSREQIEHDSTSLCNVTAEYFMDIVNVSAVPLNDDLNVNFVLTTSKGVRIYISCLERDIKVDSNLQLSKEVVRPRTVRITQIRFPPTEQSFALKGVNIYTSYISGDTCLMASGLGDDETMFWVFTSSNFVCSKRFDEHNIVLPINGCVWKIVKAIKTVDCNSQRIKRLNPYALPFSDPSLITEQHLHSAEKFFVLTSKGVSTYLHLSPVEIFRQILLKFGTESKQFQAFLAIIPAYEICVMAIIVLCSDNQLDISIKDVALRTFFVYGGEPQIRLTGNNDDLRSDDLESFKPKSALNGWKNPSALNSPRTPFQSPRVSSFSIAPLRTSTPHESQTPTQNHHLFPATPLSPAYNEHSIVAGSPTVVFSFRHDALYTYFQRILLPISNGQICFVENETFVSSFTIKQVLSVSHFVMVFQHVIDVRSLITQSHHSLSSTNLPHRQHIGDSAGRDQERLSLSNLRNEINMTCEVLKLWTILLEHDFNALISTLTPNLQKNLLSWVFHDLIKNKENICTELITHIVRFYIGDDASTSLISNRLRNCCPSIFTNDDALVVKATENLYRVKSIPNSKERKQLIDEAILTLLQSVQKLNLVQTCDLLIQIGHFQGIADLALAKAEKDDAGKLALIAYKKQINLSETVNVAEALRKRNDSYNCITDTLELLNLVAQSKAGFSISAVTLNASTFLFPSADYVKNLSSAQAKDERDNLIFRIFESDDELANVAVFRWLLAKDMTSILLENRCRFFETFLFHEIEEGKSNKYLELLWKYYEKNQNYLAAAKILNDMATKTGSRSTLNQRITYLSHALVCIQSEPETKSNLELKIEIQDQLDVAQIQLRTKNLLETRQSNAEFPLDQKKVRDAIQTLDYELLDLTEIYEKYATVFDLSEIKLNVLQCAGHYEKEVVEQIWKTILDKELSKFVNNTESEIAAQGKLGCVICKLRKHFIRTPQFVPVDFILRSLLIFSFKSSVSAEWLPNICKASEIPYSNFINVTLYEYRVGDPFWQQNQRASQFISDLVVVVCEILKNEQDRLTHNERRVLRNSCLDFLSALLFDSHSKTGGTQRSRKLEVLQSEIERILP